MSKTKELEQSDANKTRLEQLQSFGEQTKEILPSLGIDLASGVLGWCAGKVLKRNSLLFGLALTVAGRYHSLHLAMERERKRQFVYDSATKEKNALAGLTERYTDIDNHVYHGESPLFALGMGMIFGGATSMTSVNGTEKTDETFSARAKNAWQEITGDLKYRLYLNKPAQQTEISPATSSAAPVSGTDVNVLLGKNVLDEMDLSALDQMDRANLEHANAYQNSSVPISYTLPPAMNGMPDDDETVGEISDTRIM